MQGLKRVIDGEAISKPRHDPRVGFLVHLGGQEGGGHLGLHVGVIVHALIIPITAKTLADTKITESG